MKEIGALIENPPLYDNLTAYENLKVRTLALGLSEERISEVLTTVQLTNTGKKKAGQFSLGMKQRLGIALALLAQPSMALIESVQTETRNNDLIKLLERDFSGRIEVVRGGSVAIEAIGFSGR